ncbi:MAG: hypothetical protein ACLFN0_04615 [Thermovirgaceae bacterium]
MRRRGFIPILLIVLLMVIGVYSIRNMSGENTTGCLLDFIEKGGISLHARLDHVRCGDLVENARPGTYACRNFDGPEGLETIRLLTLDTNLIHAIELLIDSSKISMSSLLQEIEKKHSRYNLLFKEDSFALFVSAQPGSHGPAYLALKRDNTGDHAQGQLLIVLMTEEARRSFENAPVPESKSRQNTKGKSCGGNTDSCVSSSLLYHKMIRPTSKSG